MRWGLGPVFIYECLTSSRRWQSYAARAAMLAVLLAGMATIAWSNDGFFEGSSWRDYAELGEYYFYALVGVELALVMVAAPAAAAGAICLDRARGTLAHILVTDLSDPEIVLGKLAARLLPVLGLVACTWPLMSLSSLVGGIDPIALMLAFAVIVAVAVLGCSMAFALSVWARKPLEVVFATYTFWLLLLLAWPIWYVLSLGKIVVPPRPWLLLVNPFYLSFAPYVVPGRVGLWEYGCLFTAALGAAGILVLLAVWRMRPVTCHRAGEVGKNQGFGIIGRLGRWLPGPSLDGNPVLWREWHRSRPSRWMAAFVVILGGAPCLACVIGAFAVWKYGVNLGLPGPGHIAGTCGSIFQLLFGLLMLSAMAPTSMSEERQRGSLDVLVATPLSSRAIVLAKWWGTFRLVPLLTLGPGLMAFALATARHFFPPGGRPVYLSGRDLGYNLCGAALLVGTILAHGALLTSVGLALATWIKRPGRAIAISVCVFVLAGVAWPVLVKVSMTHSGNLASGIAALSPVWVAAEVGEQLAHQTHQLPGFLWWVAFWDIAVVSLAMGILWLTVRTFDQGFGRILERPRTSPVMADVLGLLGATASAACVFIALTIWINGVSPHGLNSDEGMGAAGYVLVVVLSLMVLSAAAPTSMPEERQLGTREVLVSSTRSARALVLTRWWRMFRLVPLLALGPGVIALALATAPRGNPDAIAIQTTLPSGEKVWKLVTSQEVALLMGGTHSKLPLANRLYSAFLMMMTILAHGAAITSIGVALGIGIKRQSWAIAGSVCWFALTALVWPASVFYLFPEVTTDPGISLLAPGAVAGFLGVNLMTREPQYPGVEWWATYWNALMSLLAIGVLWMSSSRLTGRFGAMRETSLKSTGRERIIEAASARD